ncbi:class I SAM-dependent methyltransferase [Chitinophaga sp. CF418]|uniref:class I SAM-dependent methyltransferase n=1 Tax=Chitinophaga sp. CF418 TaxID=1855287 RepID=UPI000913C8F5|nr:class I SAM-dependent methyltransferase [Chitinophaga sp. CF418]SHN34293.1 Methyltransferase domain-containing protein [Chitinophaga sp. CF418]
MTTPSAYIPALKYNGLTRFYDLVLEKLLREKMWKSYFIKNFINKVPQQVLDIGCGTATLSLMLKNTFPLATVTGLDGDRGILAIAAKKIMERQSDVKLVQGFSYELPFPDNYFDAVSSSLMIHHLSNEDKHRTFKEVYRVLKPGGEFNIADWGKPGNIATRILFYLVQLLDGFTTTRDNVKGLLPKYLVEDGFIKVQELKRFNTLLGSISIYKAFKQGTDLLE